MNKGTKLINEERRTLNLMRRKFIKYKKPHFIVILVQKKVKCFFGEL